MEKEQLVDCEPIKSNQNSPIEDYGIYNLGNDDINIPLDDSLLGNKSKTQLEFEKEIQAKGMPTIIVERPLVPFPKTDKTRYKKKIVNRLDKKEKEEIFDEDLSKDREMKFYVNEFKIKKRKSLIDKISKKILKWYNGFLPRSEK